MDDGPQQGPGSRPQQEADPRLAAAFRPRAVAVVGASPLGGIGAQVLANVRTGGFSGRLYAVHPTAKAVDGVPAFPRVSSCPGPVDLAVVCVPAGHVLDVVADCAAAKVQGLVVITAGFREAGEAGAALEAELKRAVVAGGMRMVGPNCLGIMNLDADVRLNATFSAHPGRPGGVGLMTQSGAIGIALLEHTAALHLGLARFASMGNKTDVSGNDLLLLWEQEPAVRTILLYLESLGNPRNFLRIAGRVGRSKPILVLKSGRTAAGATAARSHTGALAASDAIVGALLRQAGVLRAATVEEFLDVAQALEAARLPEGNRVGIVTNSGGPGILALDALGAMGLAPATLSPASAAALRALLPAEAAAVNPVDLLASGGPAGYEQALAILAADPGVDGLLAIHTPTGSHPEEAVAKAIVHATRATGKPSLAVFMSGSRRSPGFAALLDAHVPTYSFPENAVAALGALVRLAESRRRPAGRHPDLAVDSAAARAVCRSALAEGRAWLRQDEALAVAAAYGLPVARHARAASADGAVQAASWLGYPVVMKVEAQGLLHKSDRGGVRLGLADAAAVRAAFAAMNADLAAAGVQLREVLVMEQARAGAEVLLGITRHPAYWAAVAFGLGGVQAEVLQDVQVGLAPLTDAEAGRLVRSIRGWPILDGHRGPRLDVAALEDALVRLSRLAAEVPEVAEMDLNPVFAYAEGKGIVAVDARIRVAMPAEAGAPEAGATAPSSAPARSAA